MALIFGSIIKEPRIFQTKNNMFNTIVLSIVKAENYDNSKLLATSELYETGPGILVCWILIFSLLRQTEHVQTVYVCKQTIKIIFLWPDLRMCMHLLWTRRYRISDKTTIIIWAATRENLSSGVCEKHRGRPACTSAKSDQRLCYSLFGKNHI